MDVEASRPVKISISDGLVALIAAYGVYWSGHQVVWQFYYFRVPGSAFSTTYGLCAIGLLFAFGYLGFVLYRVVDRNRPTLWSAYLFIHLVLGLFLAMEVQSAIVNLQNLKNQSSAQPSLRR